MKLREKELAINLRKRGKTMNEIATEVGVSKSSISLWVRNLSLSQEALGRIASRQSAGQRASRLAHYEQTRQRLAIARGEAERMVSAVSITPDIALVACALLYWCEGAKDHKDGVFTFSNSDPNMIRAFMILLRKAISIDEQKLRVRMHLHAYHDEARQKEFWSQTTGIPSLQFAKTFWKPNSKKNIRAGYPGCIHIEYYDVIVARKVCATARAFLSRVIGSVVTGP